MAAVVIPFKGTADFSEVNQEVSRLRKELIAALDVVRRGTARGEIIPKQAVQNAKALTTEYSRANKQLSLMAKEQKTIQQQQMARPVAGATGFTIREEIRGDELEALKRQHKELRNVNQAFRVTQKRLMETSDGQKRWVTTTNISTNSLRRFRMEMLSVMFFGMALSRVFKEHTTQMDQLFGITDLTAAAMQYLLLPAYEDWANMMYGINEWIFGLDEGTRYWIGQAIIISQKVGEVLMTIGQAWLGIQGIKGFFETLKNARIVSNLSNMASSVVSMGKSGVSGVLGGLKSIFLWILANPIAAVIGAIALAVTALILAFAEAQWEAEKRRMQAVVDVMDDFLIRLDSLNEKVQDRLGPATSVVADAMHELVEVNVESLSGEFTDLIDKLGELRNAGTWDPFANKSQIFAEAELVGKRMQEIVDDYIGAVAFQLRPLEGEITPDEAFIRKIQIDLELGKGVDTFRDNFSDALVEMGTGLKQALRDFTIEFEDTIPTTVRKRLEGIAEEFGSLSSQFESGSISARQYVDRMAELRADLNQFSDYFTTQSIEDYVDEFNELLELRKQGVYSEAQYVQAIEDLNRGIEDSASVFKQSIGVYDLSIAAFNDAMADNSALTLDYSLEVEKASNAMLNSIFDMRGLIRAVQQGFIDPSDVEELVKTFDLSREDIEAALEAGLINTENIDTFTKAIDEKMNELATTMLDEKYEWDDATIESMENQKQQWSDLKQTVLDGAITLQEGAAQNESSQAETWKGVKDELIEGAETVAQGAQETKSKLRLALESVFGEDFTNIIKAQFDALRAIGFPVPKLAEGGLVTRPTMALVGEAGPEAVIPLSQIERLAGGEINIYVNAPISNTTDAKGMVDEVVRVLKQQLSSEVLI